MTSAAQPLAGDPRDAAAPDPMIPRCHQVAARRGQTPDTFTLRLVPADGDAPARFLPGQFTMVYAFGVGESAISISGDPADRDALELTIRSVGTVTRTLHALEAGDAVGLRGPFGSAWPLADAMGRDVLLVAGGIGLAPLRPVVLHLLQHREQYGAVTLLVGARSPADLLFHNELARWDRDPRINVHITVDVADAAWRGHVGVVTPYIRRVCPDANRTVALLCGPEIMMRFAVTELYGAGLADDQVYVSMERNMQCGIAHCGHCQYGPELLCRDGPVYPYQRVKRLFDAREI